MITNVTMNMCGTLGPYGIAVTSVRPSLRGEPAREREVEDVADEQLDAERGQDRPVDVVAPGSATTPIAQAGEHEDVDEHVDAEAEEGVEVAAGPEGKRVHAAIAPADMDRLR